MTPLRIPSGQIACFRIYPEPGRSRLYYQVRVFSSVQAIRDYLPRSKEPYRRLGRYGVAMCSSYTVNQLTTAGPFRRLPICGEIVFSLRRLRAGVIAHECAHAALGWARRIGLAVEGEPAAHPRRQGNWVHANEERFCYALGELNRQIAVQVWDRHLHTD